MQLLERDTPLDQLQAVLDRVLEGDGHLVLVAGEAGIGKTALTQQFCRSVRGQADVLVGACDPLSTPTPLGPLFDIAPQLGDEFQEQLRRPAPSRQLYAALLAELACGPRPRVLLLEDVHWADAATLDLLRFLARRATATRALILATYRDDELGPRHPLRIALGDVASLANLVRINLRPLSLSAVAELASGMGIDVRELHQRTGGNPFFVNQVLAAPHERLPMTVRDALLARIARLSPPARGALEAAAVLGPRVEPNLIEAVIDGPPEALDACVEAGLLVMDHTSYAFRHELLREAVLAELSRARQVALHRRVLAALIERGVRDEHLATVAHHGQAAGDRAAVLEFAPAAARRASQLGAHREAAAQYARALRWADLDDRRERAQLLEQRSLECYLTDQTADAIEARGAALATWRALGEREREGDSLRWLSRMLWVAGRNPEAEQASQEALRVLESLAPGLALGWAYSNRAQLLMLSADMQPAIHDSERAAQLAESLRAKELHAHALMTLGSARWHTGDERGREEILTCLRISIDNGFDDHAGRAFANLISSSITCYELQSAETWIERGIAYTREHDLSMYALYLESWQAILRLLKGRWTEAIELAEAIERRPERSLFNHINALTVIGRVRARRGDPKAWEALDEALELVGPIGELQRLAPVRSARAEAAWLSGDAARAVSEAQAVYALAADKRVVSFSAEPAYWLWRTGQLAAPDVQIAQPFASAVAGDWAGAARRWEQLGCPYEQAQALALAEDVDPLRHALGIARQLGALPLEAFVVGRLRQLGTRPASPRPRQAPAASVGGLSARQREVVELVAQGYTNREIADRLVISARTAENHMQAIMNRLGLRSRAEVAAWAVQHEYARPRRIGIAE